MYYKTLLLLVLFTPTTSLFGQTYSDTINLEAYNAKLSYVEYVMDDATILLKKDSINVYLKALEFDSSTYPQADSVQKILLKQLAGKEHIVINHDSDISFMLVWQYVKAKILVGEFALRHKGKYLTTIQKSEEIDWADFGDGMSGGGSTIYNYWIPVENDEKVSQILIFSFE